MTSKNAAEQPEQDGMAADAKAPQEDAAPSSGGERIVIRDKRKVTSKPSPKGKPAAAPEAAEQPADGDGQPVPVPEPGQIDTAAEAEPPAEPVEAGESSEAGEAAAAGEVKVEPEAGGLAGELAELRAALDERTTDLQRVTAEYANYRKRVDRDRTVSAELAVGGVLTALLPVLDDLDRAREHGDLEGPFAAVAEQLGNALAKFGLVEFGAKGDPFDPTRHEAVAHLPSDEVTEPTCIDVMRRGYLLGERLLRPAMVAVAAPE